LTEHERKKVLAALGVLNAYSDGEKATSSTGNMIH
jgi:hypothetical protein